MMNVYARRLVSSCRRTLGTQRCFSVYTWGVGDDGQLGHPTIDASIMTNKYVETAPRLVEHLESQNVTDVSCGFSHTGVVTQDGRVLTFGKPEGPLLGHDNGGSSEPCVHGRLVTGALEGVKAKSISCGEHHTGVLSKDGDLYTWGWGGSFFSGAGALGTGVAQDEASPVQVLFGGSDDVKLTQIASGRKHMIGLDTEGVVWTWGCGENGRLGNGSSSDQLEPYPVDYFLELDIKCKAVAAGNSFCLVLTEDGQVYGFGKNDQSQLGLGGGISMDVYAMADMPQLIESIETERIAAIAAGGSQALAIDERGHVYSWGMRLWMEPHLMSILNDHKIVQGDCGHGFYSVLSSSGQLFTWGKGILTRQAGVLGHGHTKRVAQPEMVESMANIPLQKISCGNRHVAAISRSPKL